MTAEETQRKTVAYAPPGPLEDPWGIYTEEASIRYNVPEGIIRAVMNRESGGLQWMAGKPVTSSAGAMGLMQLMPVTYKSLSTRLGLGTDPYMPRDNIMAGTYMIGLMVRQYGVRGGLSAYNMGPGAYEAWMAGEKDMPHETEDYTDIVEADIPARQKEASSMRIRRRAALERIACLKVWIKHGAILPLRVSARMRAAGMAPTGGTNLMQHLMLL